MEEQWHLLHGGRQSGPHTFDELRGLLSRVDPEKDQVLVWTESLKEWSDPRTVPGLMATAAATAAAAPRPVQTAPARSHAGLNPYETPASSLAPVATAVGEYGNYELDVGACIQTGWTLTKAHFWKLVLFGLAYIGLAILLSVVTTVILGATGMASGAQQGEIGSSLGQLAVNLVQQVVSIFLGIGAAMFGLGIVRRTNPSIGTLFAGGPHLVPVLLATLVYVVAVFLGLFLLVIPGIILAIRLGQFQMVIIDRNLGPIDALKASWAMTRGNFWNMVLLGLAGLGIVILGLLALGVGLLWAYPTVLLAGAAAYVCMSQSVRALPQTA